MYLVSPIPLALLNTVVVNHWCSVTNTKCKPNIVGRSLVRILFIIDLQLMLGKVSLTKCFFIKIRIIHDIISIYECWDVEYTKLRFDN